MRDHDPNHAGLGQVPWTEVRHGKKAKALSPKVTVVSAAASPRAHKGKNVSSAPTRAPVAMNAGNGTHSDEGLVESLLGHTPAPTSEASYYEPASSRMEGSSKRQGKTVARRNWGAVGIDPEELDLEDQRRMFEYYASSSRAASEVPLIQPDALVDVIESSPAFEPWRKHQDSRESAERVPAYEPAARPLVAQPSEAFSSASARPSSGLDPAHENTLRELESSRAGLEAMVALVASYAAESNKDNVPPVQPQHSAPESASRGAPASSASRANKVCISVPDDEVLLSTTMHGENLRPVNQVEPSSYLFRTCLRLVG